jgi:hypothetical protein
MPNEVPLECGVWIWLAKWSHYGVVEKNTHNQNDYSSLAMVVAFKHCLNL